MFRLLLLLVSAAWLPGCTDGGTPSPLAAQQWAGFDPAELDPAVPPGGDFWRHVNGRWLAATGIPADRASYGIYQQLSDQTESQLRAIVEGQDADPQLADLYRSFMDEARLAQLGVDPLGPELAYISAIRTSADVVHWMGASLAAGIEGPVSYYIDSDARDPVKNLAYFWQDGLGLPDRDYYLTDSADLRQVRAAYRAHIREMFRLAAWDGGTAAAKTIMALETRLARAQWSAEQNRDDERIYASQFDVAAAMRATPGFDWSGFLAIADFGTPERFVLAQADYFAALGALIRDTPVADWQAYFRFRALRSLAPYLAPEIAAEDFRFEGSVLRGQQQDRPRWRRAVSMVSSELGELLGRAYVARHFPAENRARIVAMIENLRAACGRSLDELDWMSPATRKAAQLKLAAFRTKVGYPDRWIDYSSVTIRADDLVGNLRRTRAFAHRRNLERLAKPADPDEWDMTPQTLNAYYRSTHNEIVFPAAFLQPPYFDPEADDAWNYGSIGATIGHEISHGFDDQGRKFDAAGRLRNWWSEGDAREYELRAAALVEQFSRYEPLAGVAINGRLTLGENIADLAGLVLAYRAYRHSLGGIAPPVIAGYSGDQRFFISYAWSFREKDRAERLREMVLRDPHSPAEYRVTGILKNVPEFLVAFGVKPGDPMYLPAAQRVRIW